MVASLRHFLILLLVLLQVAAPLVHAHVGDSMSGHGLHLHEFEMLQVKPHQQSFANLDYQARAVQSAIVEVGSAIKIRPQVENFTPIVYIISGMVANAVMPAAGPTPRQWRAARPASTIAHPVATPARARWRKC